MTLLPYAAVAVLVAAIGGMFFGMDIQEDRTRAQLLAQEQSMHTDYVGRVSQFRAIAHEVSQELNDATSKRQADAVAFRAELARARSGAVRLAECPPAGTGVRLTGAFVGLYDGALAIGTGRVPSAGDPGRADAPAARPDSVEPADVLAVHAENAEAWAECRAALSGWQSLARKQGWVK